MIGLNKLNWIEVNLVMMCLGCFRLDYIQNVYNTKINSIEHIIIIIYHLKNYLKKGYKGK